MKKGWGQATGSLQCFDTDGWVTEQTFGPAHKKPCSTNLRGSLPGQVEQKGMTGNRLIQVHLEERLLNSSSSISSSSSSSGSSS